MHDLHPVTALGGATPRIDRFDHITITENDAVQLASVAARLGQETACHQILSTLAGHAPAPGKSAAKAGVQAFWIGPDQWMVMAELSADTLLADTLKSRLAATASVTEQSGAWVCFDVAGPAMPALSERLCAVDIHALQAGDAQRSVIHQMGCFILRGAAADHLRILGPRASAKSLHGALIQAAQATA